MRLFFMFIVWMSAASAHAAPQTIAVLDFQLDPEDSKLQKMLEDEIRAGLLEYTSPQELRVLSRSQNQQRLSEYEPPISCKPGECERALARTLQVDFVVTGELSAHKEDWYLFLKLFAAKDGALIGSHTLQKTSAWALVQGLKDESFSLYARLPVRVERMFSPPAVEAESAVQPPAEENDWKEELEQVEAEHQEDKRQKIAEEETVEPAIEEEDEEEVRTERRYNDKVHFSLLSIQCNKRRTGFVPFGYCHDGNFLGTIHTGWLVHSEVDSNFLGLYQISIVNESESFFGLMQLGLYNKTKKIHVGGQLGTLNSPGELL